MANIIFGAQLSLQYKHGISVSAEMIFFFYGGIVHVHHEIITCELPTVIIKEERGKWKFDIMLLGTCIW